MKFLFANLFLLFLVLKIPAQSQLKYDTSQQSIQKIQHQYIDSTIKILEYKLTLLNSNNTQYYKTLLLLANKLTILHQNEKAIIYYLQCDKYYLVSDDTLGLISVNSGLAKLYNNLRDYHKEKIFQFKALNYCSIIKYPIQRLLQLTNIAFVCMHEGNYDSALKYYKDASECIKFIKDMKAKIDYQNYILYLEAFPLSYYTKYKESNAKLYSVINSFKETNKFCLMYCYYLFGFNFNKMNLNLKASNYMDSAIQICKELNIPAEMIKLKQTKYEIDSANSNWRAALKDLADISTLKDSLYNVNSIVANKELIAKYETEKIEREKSILLETQRIYKIAIAIAIILLAFILLLLVKKRQQNKKLNELVIFRNKIQTIISHDFRSPLFALQGLYEQANYFIEKKDLVQLKKLSTNIDETSNRIGSLLKNLITWAESSKTSFYKKNKISLYKKTMDTIELYHNILQNKNIKIHNNINKDLLVNANANVFDLLVRNWLDNLLKYANADTIEITATQKDNEMLISIFDNGVIDQNKMAYIQQQFLNKKDVNINETSSGFGLELMTYFSKKEGWQLNFKAVQDLNEFTIAIPVA